MGFFPDDPPAPPRPPRTRAPRMPRMRSPQDEVPTVLPFAAVLAQTDHIAIVLTDVRVHREGIEFGIDRMLRRGEMSDEEWWELEPKFSGHFYRGPMPSSVRPLRFGVELADGTRVIGDGPRHFLPPSDDLPGDEFTISVSGGGGGGDDEFTAMREGIWLYPVPPAGPLALVLRWPDLGIDETRFEIEPNDWPALAAKARPVWPDSPVPGAGRSGAGWSMMTAVGRTDFRPEETRPDAPQVDSTA